jgi:hypothetical protein
MRTFFIILLAVFAFALGGFGAIAYSGAKGSMASLRIACELLNTAEVAGVLSRQQRSDVVDRTILELNKSSARVDAQVTEFIGQFKAGCPTMPNW